MSTVRRLLELMPALEVHLATVIDPKSVKGRTEHGIGEAPAAGLGQVHISTPLPRLVESHGEAMERISSESQNWLKDLGHKELPGTEAQLHAVWSEHAAEAINKLADEIGADVIVMATHGRSGISHMVAGSVTEGVIRHAKRPVLVHGPNTP